MSDPQNRFFKRFFLVVACAVMALAPAAFAQLTTGNIAGSVLSGTDALPGVTIEAVHTPTGTRYDTVSAANGRFLIPNVRVGGPYTITASLEGFRPGEAKNVQVGLGQTAEVAMKMALATVSEAITVTATADDVINPNRTGSATQVSEETIESLPTVNRQLQDFARTNPYVTTSLTGDGTFMTIAGRNNRYNNISIDGAVNNDLFGLSSSGTPGGGSETQPITLDAIQEIQILISPYDVRQSGFTGGGMNAVTRSGTNDFTGSIFGTQRNLDYVGENETLPPLAAFDQTQYGGRLGGRIIRDRLFFFVSGEKNTRDQPNGTRACIDLAECTTISNARKATPAGQPDPYPGVYAGTPNAFDVANFLKTKYNYDSGDLNDITFASVSKLFFGRIDANIGSSNNLTLRHNYVDAQNTNAPSSFSRTASRFYFPNNVYLFPSKTNSTVAQLNSVLNANMFNEARVGWQTIREHRETPGDLFPTIEIGAAQRQGSLQTGIERFSGANALDQDILELTDDFTWTFGNHSLVLGTSNQMFKFANTFISDFYGYYLFPDLAALQAGTPSQYAISFATGADPKRPTQFKAAQYSLYASDQWRVGHGVTLTLGLRADRPQFDTTPSFNANVQNLLGYNTSDVASENITWEPRVGFNWDIGQAGKQQLRGGIGIFQGRAPFVWISNAYGGTGIEQVSLTCSGSCVRPAFNPDPNNQPRNLGAAAAQDISLTDPDFQFPRVLRATLGYDRELFYGIRASAELLLSQTQQDVFYYNVAKKENGVSPLDGRKRYTNVAPTIGNAYFLTNTDEGEEFTQTLTLDKSFGKLHLNTNFMHQSAKSVGDFTSSTARSQWEFGYISRTGDALNPELTTSVFQIENRFNASASYNFNTFGFSHNIGAFWVAQTGQPFSFLMGGDINGDGSSNNDLLYIPANVIVCPSTATGAATATSPCRIGSGATGVDVAPITNQWAEFLKYFGADPSKDNAPQRNSFRAPWTRRLDLSYELGLPQIMGTRVSVQADILNVMNLINEDYGIQQFVTNNTYIPVNFIGNDPATGRPIYREAGTDRLKTSTVYSTANLASRWQGRLGIRISF
ncbi:MAG TPA: carboxypeptidase regulatory-like domain-containing protein [Thermoanaerobaculia bacterium]|nr:carboxypeptidase regulatory-like domain-containing protein [Thermoanaerobaculia bacterium]